MAGRSSLLLGPPGEFVAARSFRRRIRAGWLAGCLVAAVSPADAQGAPAVAQGAPAGQAGQPAGPPPISFVQEVPLGIQDHMQHGVAWGDYDNDGDPDVLITTEKGAFGQKGFPRSVRLYRNETRPGQRARFTDVTVAAGIHNENVAANEAVWEDYDRDGLLDIFISTTTVVKSFGQSRCQLFRNQGPDGSGVYTFVDEAQAAGVAVDHAKDPSVPGCVGPPNSQGANCVGIAWGDINGDGWPDLFVGEKTYGPCGFTCNCPLVQQNLFLNQGSAAGAPPTFLDVTPPGLLLPTEDVFSGVFADLEGDGDLDLFLGVGQSGHSGSPGDERIFVNDGAGGLTELASTGLNDAMLDGFVSIADYDQDGLVDLWIGNWDALGSTPVSHSGQLYHNEGSGAPAWFQNVSSQAGIDVTGYDYAGCTWGDFDNDGDTDLILGTAKKVFPGHLYRNLLAETGAANFARESGSPGLDVRHFHIGMPAADIDGDGLLDAFFSTEQDGQSSFPGWSGPVVLHNRTHTTSRAVRVDPRPRRSGGRNGQVVVAETAGGLRQSEVLGGETSAWGASELVAHLGLGAAAAADRVEVHWTSGIVQTVEDLAAGTHRIDERGIHVLGNILAGTSTPVEIVGPPGAFYWLYSSQGLTAGQPVCCGIQGTLDLDPNQPFLQLVAAGVLPASGIAPITVTAPAVNPPPGSVLYLQALLGMFPEAKKAQDHKIPGPAMPFQLWDAVAVGLGP